MGCYKIVGIRIGGCFVDRIVAIQQKKNAGLLRKPPPISLIAFPALCITAISAKLFLNFLSYIRLNSVLMKSMPSMKKKPAKSRSRDVAAHSADALRTAQNTVNASTKNWVNRQHFILGAGSVLDLAGSNLRTPELESLRDDVAKIRSDFYKIGGDFRDVLGRVHRLG